MTGYADKTLLGCDAAVWTSGGATCTAVFPYGDCLPYRHHHERADAHRDAVWLFQYEEVRIPIQACIIRLHPRDGY
ncbi:hypothetical protein [Xylella fastidiosa]|uniref:hypothetical protein n=1 Tax=Xylella fastidiosa TaxID=2371 RepID=UPI00041CC2D3|nr:hypothetical protein [Xylella fastidiosa]KFA40605.1 hypothetical protein DF22_002815 [Xylella fastidiosa]MDC7969979.1 hypothetical protein [Xylella fastidiosa subsp. multiplex]MDD0926454.1 hypothetical protein [Xylella fastidiosa subsp. multiplex]RWA38624.1 hypothetical protein XfCFBP8078_01855 [Xylella fastidiosa subsp. multiplex]WDF06773.1 hypothetical protein PT012_10025 [Xylella fastidiosa subsp. multiplex]